jgi:hypothetical protein
MTDYVIAIPSYNRVDGIISKSLSTLHKYHIPHDKIYIYVKLKHKTLNIEAKNYLSTFIKSRRNFYFTLNLITLSSKKVCL